MTDKNASGQPEGQALPASRSTRLGAIANTATVDAERVLAAVERWYERHFHRCAVAGVAPVSADDKAELLKHLAEAVAPAATEE